jgi:hypothetical protein
MKKYILISIAIGLILSLKVMAEGFNPNYILDDNEINDCTSMTLADIQQFLNDRGGFLASYKTNSCLPEDVTFGLPCSGPVVSAAQIIFDRAVTNRINPKFILVLLQKEMSLVEKKSVSQSSLDWAVGYGCFDGQTCKERFRGFWKQINSATLQFRDYMDNPQSYSFKIGQSYFIDNGNSGYPAQTVIPQNQATCAFYTYTPHVYNGNYNFYKIWSRYFIRDYPNGTLMQASGEQTVWVLQNGMKRPFKSRGALISRYDISKVITVGKTDLDKYITGAPITFPQYSLVRAPSGALYLLVDDTRRGFTSKLAFAKLGFNPDEIVSGSWPDLKAYTEVAPLTATSVYPTGALLQDKKTGGVYWVINGLKAPIPDRIYLTTLFKNKKIQKTNSADLAKLTTTDPVRFPDGELIRGIANSAVYVIADGKKHAIQSAKVFTSLKYSWNNVMIVPDKILYLFPDGDPLKEKTDSSNIGNLPDQTILISTSTPIATSTIN